VLKLAVVALVVFALAVVMTMTGRGGGNFYVLTLVLAGTPMHEAATTGQFVLFSTSLAATLIFHRHKTVSWPLTLFIGGLTAVMAFVGGFAAHAFSGVALKVVFSLALVCAGTLMLWPESTSAPEPAQGRRYWRLRGNDAVYFIDLWVAMPVAMATGVCAGMVGVSGGSFLVPLMVLACRVPMRIAVGTASTMVAATAFTGFLGHALHGTFNPSWAVPLAGVAVFGGILGGKTALKTKPTHLRTLFALTTLAAAIVMIANALASA
jgi:uncharacterized membrane protein YfcA